MEGRITRSRSRQPSNDQKAFINAEDASTPGAESVEPQTLDSTIVPLPSQLSRKITGLAKDDFQVLLLKQERLRSSVSSASHDIDDVLLAQATAATLVFAQQEAGTAVCISSSGLLLTCGHCVADSEEAETGVGEERWLVFASGQAVRARCTAWDPTRDLAILQIIAAQPGCDFDAFPAIAVSASPPKFNAMLFCIGHPGAEDLEASTAGIATDYDVLHTSEGRFKGFAKNQDPQDNSEIGALKHNCWTYWGHSGAPLVQRDVGGLVGLHSSWDDETAMRRGVPLEAIRAFLVENGYLHL